MKHSFYATILAVLTAAVLLCCCMLPASAAEAEAAYTGRGTVIAVLDSGFAPLSKFFRHQDMTGMKLDRQTIESLRSELNGKGVYKNAKLAWLWDYADNDATVSAVDDHGTQTAGIIGASGEQYAGIAPDAQLLLMWVFDDKGNTDDDILIAAIEDAITLGADIISLSVGVPAGYASGLPFGEKFAECLDKAEKAGVLIVASAGNSGGAGNGSQYDSLYGIALTPVTTPDSGTVASPASYDSVLAVGALESDTVKALCFTHGDEKIRCTDTSYTYVDPIGQDMAAHFDRQTLTYVPIGGVGAAEDFEGLDLGGKLKEVAGALGLSEGRVRSRLNRANDMLRDRLKEWYYDEES